MKNCNVDDCERSSVTRGMCDKHYQRWRSHGDATVVLKPFGRSPRVTTACSIDGCDRAVVARSLCGKHYQRWVKYGDPLVVKQDRTQLPEDRFWSKVNKGGPVSTHRPDLGNCWVWTGGLAEGYGVFWLDGRQEKAHILSFTWAKGEIEEGQERDHLCRNRACVNPDHLEAVTHWVNVARGISPHGKNAVKTHCPQGHPYDEANTRIDSKGSRVCIECSRASFRNWYHRQATARAANS